MCEYIFIKGDSEAVRCSEDKDTYIMISQCLGSEFCAWVLSQLQLFIYFVAQTHEGNMIFSMSFFHKIKEGNFWSNFKVLWPLALVIVLHFKSKSCINVVWDNQPGYLSECLLFLNDRFHWPTSVGMSHPLTEDPYAVDSSSCPSL